MALGMSQYLANNVFDAICNATSFSVATPYIQLHTADPGSAGTTAVATENTRKLVSFSAAAAGVITSDAAVDWTAVAGTETYSHYSMFDAATVGNFLWSDTMTASGVTALDDFQIPIGDIDLAINLAA